MTAPPTRQDRIDAALRERNTVAMERQALAMERQAVALERLADEFKSVGRQLIFISDVLANTDTLLAQIVEKLETEAEPSADVP